MKKSITLTQEQQDWLDQARENYSPIETWEGLDYAIIGVINRCSDKYYFVYSKERMVEVFMRRDGMTESQAIEFIEFNVEGAWLGKGTPFMLVDTLPVEVHIKTCTKTRSVKHEVDSNRSGSKGRRCRRKSE